MGRIEVNGIHLNVEVYPSPPEPTALTPRPPLPRAGEGEPPVEVFASGLSPSGCSESVRCDASGHDTSGRPPSPASGRGVGGEGRGGEGRGGESRPAILLLHGFTGGIDSWRARIPALARHATVVAVDLIGHGRSDASDDPARYTMGRCVEDLLALLDRLGLARVAVLGYSMGARVALHLAAAAPDRVAALILESGSPGLATEEERAARRAADEALALRIEREGVEKFVDYWETIPLFASQRGLPPEAWEEQRRQRLCNGATGLANSLRGMGTGAQGSLRDRLDGITAPTLLIAGASDEKFRAIARAMAAALPRARLVVVPGAGHTVHLEQPGEFDRVVMDFLEVNWPATKLQGCVQRRTRPI